MKSKQWKQDAQEWIKIAGDATCREDKEFALAEASASEREAADRAQFQVRCGNGNAIGPFATRLEAQLAGQQYVEEGWAKGVSCTMRVEAID